MFTIPYFLRCWRLYAVVSQIKLVPRSERRKHTRVYWARERNLFLFGVMILGVIGFISIIACALPSLRRYLPANANEQYDCIEPGLVTLSVNTSVAIIIVMYAIENAILLLFIHLLRHVQDDFSIASELRVIFATWFLSSFLIIVCVIT